MPVERNDGPFARIVKVATKIEPHELKATALSFAFVFVLMAAYFILRPVRDAMASEWSNAELSWLWSATFAFSTLAVVIYGAVIPHVKFRRLVPSVYAFFSATFVAFYFGSSLLPNPVLVDKTFYVWLSVFSLFHVSVFWSFMSGLFTKEQAPRLFAIIATGASAGAAAGPIVPTFFAEEIGVMNLLVIAAGMLLIPIPIIAALERLKVTELGNENVQVDLSKQVQLARNPFSGFTVLFRDRYLLGIGIFILLYVTMNTFFYFELRDLLREFERATRARVWGSMDLIINSLAIVTAMFGTGRLATRFGMGATLALVPVLLIGGLATIAIAPILPVLAGTQIARRAGNYAVTRPAREMLFTLVDQDTRYKAKPVVDIVVYRGGDVLTSWAYTGVVAAFGLGLTGIAILAAAIAAIWAAVGMTLGRSYDRSPSEPRSPRTESA